MSFTTEPSPIETVDQEDVRAATRRNRWPRERVLFALAGTMVLVSVALAVLVSPWFLLLTAFVGVNQWLYVTVAACPASLLLSRLGVTSHCRW